MDEGGLDLAGDVGVNSGAFEIGAIWGDGEEGGHGSAAGETDGSDLAAEAKLGSGDAKGSDGGFEAIVGLRAGIVEAFIGWGDGMVDHGDGEAGGHAAI